VYSPSGISCHSHRYGQVPQRLASQKHPLGGLSKLFDVAEINLMEKQLLYLLDYDLRFDELEACTAFIPFMSVYSQSSASTRLSAVSKVAIARAEAQQQSQERANVQLPPTPPDEEKESRYPAPMQVATTSSSSLSSSASSVSSST
jgi:G1/S-specific cyclin PLC1